MNMTKHTARTKTAVIATALLFGTLIAPILTSCSDDKPSSTGGTSAAATAPAALMAAEATELAKEAWLFGLPLVMFEKQIDYSTHVTQAGETRAPINQFVHYRKFVDASNRSIVGFNVDNLYSLAWIDLKDEPLVLSVPAMGDRYWMMQIVDTWNGVPAAPGSRTHRGDNPHVFLIAGPDWKGTVPEGMELLRSPTNLAGIGGRTYCARSIRLCSG